MGLGKHIGGRLTKNVVEGYLKQINGARSENNVGLILTGARKKYNSKPGIKRQPTNEGYVTANDENTQQKTTTRAAAATLRVRRPIKKTNKNNKETEIGTETETGTEIGTETETGTEIGTKNE